MSAGLGDLRALSVGSNARVAEEAAAAEHCAKGESAHELALGEMYCGEGKPGAGEHAFGISSNSKEATQPSTGPPTSRRRVKPIGTWSGGEAKLSISALSGHVALGALSERAARHLTFDSHCERCARSARHVR